VSGGPPVEAVEWRSWARSQSGVGENPIWEAATGELYWIDIVGQTLHRSACAGGPFETWDLPAMAGTYALHDDGALVVLADGIHDLDFATGLRKCIPAPYDRDLYNFNDGRCDPAGRLWVGTNRRPGSGAPRGSASMWRLDARGLVGQFGGVTIANGLAFSPAGSTMYTADSINHVILARHYDLDTGTAGEPRVFAELDGDLFPDGAAVDCDGGYWVAMYGNGSVHRYAADGGLDRVIKTPFSHPTMVAFGGAGLATMFVTSGRSFVSPGLLAKEPQAGDVVYAQVGTLGLAEPKFAHRDHLLAQCR